MRRLISLGVALLFTLSAWAADGVENEVGDPSEWRNLVPAQKIEQQAAADYEQLKRQARAKQALASADHPELQRLRRIAKNLIPFASHWNPRAQEWKWEVNLLGSKQINAFCMPGGKIAFYWGILDTLKLTDDEVAVVMGHEIAHALREHARERAAKNEATQIGATLLGLFVGGGKFTSAFDFGGKMLTLKFSRDDETEADVVGLDLAARAGYDPRAGITLWQKMTAANRAAPPQWLSTHPAGSDRIIEIEKHLPQVMPLYEQAKR